ncbi:reverse transcriptase domain-containing protein [Tanacetum coccineum]
MADNRTMAQMLQAPIEGYEDAIVVPLINANNFELKQTLINLVQSNQFTGRQDPHNHLRFFNKVTSTFRHPDVPNTSIKLLLFPFSLEGEARTWLDKEPPRSILTWDDLVSKFINQFFPPSKTTYLRNEIINFLQKPNETFNEAWERFKGLLRQCPHHGFSELHQLDTFYNSLNTNDQDALDSAAGGNFLDKNAIRWVLAIIESKQSSFSRSHAIEPNRWNIFQTKEQVYQPRNEFNHQFISSCRSTNSERRFKADFEKYVKPNGSVLRNMQNQGKGLQNQMTNLMEMLSKFITSNTASSSNPGPSTPFPTPVVSTPLKEPEQNPEASIDKVQKLSLESTAQVPPPEEKDSIFIEIPKPKAKKTVNVEIPRA